jgi:hypothetical protein
MHTFLNVLIALPHGHAGYNAKMKIKDGCYVTSAPKEEHI